MCIALPRGGAVGGSAKAVRHTLQNSNQIIGSARGRFWKYDGDIFISVANSDKVQQLVDWT